MRGALWCFAILVGCGASAPLITHHDKRPTRPAAPSAPTPRSAPTPPSTPAARTDRLGIATDPALASAAAAYGRLDRVTISRTAVSPDIQMGIEEVLSNVRLASALAADVDIACQPLEQSPGPLQTEALTLHADAFDLLASRVAAATLPIPGDLATIIRRASPEIRADLERQFRERIAAAFSARARPLACTAVGLYRQVLAIDPTHARASAQLAAYGDAFVRACP